MILTRRMRGVRLAYVSGKYITFVSTGAASCFMPDTYCGPYFFIFKKHHRLAATYGYPGPGDALQGRKRADRGSTTPSRFQFGPLRTRHSHVRARAWGWSGNRFPNPGRPHDSRIPVPIDPHRKMGTPARPTQSVLLRTAHFPQITRTGQ